MPSLTRLMAVLIRVAGFAVAGGVIGLLIACVCEEVGIVRYTWYGDSLKAAFTSMSAGAVAGGSVGVYRAARR